MSEASEAVSTGLRVRRPSDDPLAAKRLQALDLRLARLERHQQAASRADARLRQTDGTLEQVVGLLDELKALGLQGANSTVNAEDAALIAEEMTSLIEQMRDLGNTRDDQGFLFTGARADTAPVSDAFEVTTLDRALSAEVGEGLRVRNGLLASEVFGDGTPDTAQVFDVVVALRDAVRDQDFDDMETALDGMEGAIDQVIGARGTTGVLLGRVDGAMAVLDQLQSSLPVERAELVEADFVEAVNELSRAESMFQASLAASGRAVSSQTLLEFL